MAKRQSIHHIVFVRFLQHESVKLRCQTFSEPYEVKSSTLGPSAPMIPAVSDLFVGGPALFEVDLKR